MEVSHAESGISLASLEFNDKGGWNVGEELSGIYNIDARGWITLKEDTDEGKELIGAVNRACSLALVPGKFDDELGINLIIKKPETAGAWNLKGERYNYLELWYDPECLELGSTAGYVEFDANEAIFTSHEEYSSTGEPEGTEGPYSYSISDLGILDFKEIEALQGFASTDSNFIALVNNEAEEIALILMVKGGTPDAASLCGRYNSVDISFGIDDSDGFNQVVDAEIETGSIIFDGRGNWQDDEKEGETGTYDVDENGRLVVNCQNTYSPASPDGSLAIEPDMDASEDNDLGLCFILSTPIESSAQGLPGVLMLLLDEK
jgi:hypothetical protein